MTAPGPGLDACAEMRRAMQVACARSRDAQSAHGAASERTRELRRRLVTARRAAEAAAEAGSADRRREEKERLREAYDLERAGATSDAELAEATARWARGVDRINRVARRAQRGIAAAQKVVTALEGSLLQAEQSEQAARVAAQSADAGCLSARVQLAACEERTAGGPGRPPAPGGPPRPGPAPRVDPGVIHPRIGQGGPTVIEALLTRDRRWLEAAAMAIAEHVGRPPAQVLLHVRELIDSILALASARGYVTIEGDHPFWSRLSDGEDRDVLAALVRLGFQVEPPLGWHGDRAPSPSDLSMALAYAGIEARGMRNLPTSAELRELPRSIAVDARALLIAEAPDLALDHIVPMLAERADALAPLWEDWGQIRLLLLADPRALGPRLR